MRGHSVDMWGEIAGVATRDQIIRGGHGYPRAQQQMTAEANAAILTGGCSAVRARFVQHLGLAGVDERVDPGIVLGETAGHFDSGPIVGGSHGSSTVARCRELRDVAGDRVVQRQCARCQATNAAQVTNDLEIEAIRKLVSASGGSPLSDHTESGRVHQLCGRGAALDQPGSSPTRRPC